ncbi:histone H3, partial [Blastomyces dermatitidis ATCC 18188]
CAAWESHNPQPCAQRVDHCKSLHEIHFYQKSGDFIFFKTIFTHLVCEINERNHQFQHSVLDVIQVAAEFTLITLFE